jgi:SAM-dependent methyltransferase
MDRDTLVRVDLQKPHWGNYEANLSFLTKTGLLSSRLNVLEIGCGKGAIVRALHAKGHRVCGIDRDLAVLREGRAPDAAVTTLAASGDALPFRDGEFDVVLSFDVFEHIPDSDRHVSEVSRVLKPGGSYLIQTPNKLTNVPFETVRFSRKYGLRNAFKFLEYPEHCALHTYWSLRRRLERHGFHVTYHDVAVVNEFFRFKLRRFLGPLGVAALRVINPDKLPMPLRTNLFVEARRKA